MITLLYLLLIFFQGNFFFVDFDDGRYVPMLGNIGRWDWYQTLPQYSEVTPHIEEVIHHTDVPRKRISRPLRQWFGVGQWMALRGEGGCRYTAVKALVWNNGTLLCKIDLTEISASRQDRRVLQKSKIIRIEFLSKWGMLQTSRYV